MAHHGLGRPARRINCRLKARSGNCPGENKLASSDINSFALGSSAVLASSRDLNLRTSAAIDLLVRCGRVMREAGNKIAGYCFEILLPHR